MKFPRDGYYNSRMEIKGDKYRDLKEINTPLIHREILPPALTLRGNMNFVERISFLFRRCWVEVPNRIFLRSDGFASPQSGVIKPPKIWMAIGPTLGG